MHSASGRPSRAAAPMARPVSGEPTGPERWTTRLARHLFNSPGGRPQTLLVQVPLTLILLAFWLASSDYEPGQQRIFGLAFALSALFMVLGFLVPWRRLPRRTDLLIPALDFVPIAMAAVPVHHMGMGLLAVLPAVWLSTSGVSAATTLPLVGAGSTMISAPALLLHVEGAAADEIILVVLTPLIMVALAASIHAAAAKMRSQSRQILHQREQLSHSLAEARGSEELFRTTLEAVDVGVLAIDAHGRPLLRNTQQREFLRVAASGSGLPVEGTGPAERTVPEQREEEPDVGPHVSPGTYRHVFGPDRTTPLEPGQLPEERARRGEEFTDQLIWIGRGGGQRAISVTARALGDPAAAPGGSVLASSDVTELMDALTAKDRFLSHVTHDLRTPLTAILGRADLALERGGLPERTRTDLEAVVAGAERLQAMVQDLLFSASETLRMEPRRTDLAPLVYGSLGGSEHHVTDADVQIVAEVIPAGGAGVEEDGAGGAGGEHVWAHADPVRILQVLDNLLSNAIKYSPEGGVITVRARTEDAGTQTHGEGSPAMAVLEVEDHGDGMSEAEAEHVFNRFYRTDVSRRSGVPGVGLGLYITKAIVDAHGGTVTCTSTPGVGTTFTVRLPVEAPGESSTGSVGSVGDP